MNIELIEKWGVLVVAMTFISYGAANINTDFNRSCISLILGAIFVLIRELRKTTKKK
jgi:hypothetical protein